MTSSLFANSARSASTLSRTHRRSETPRRTAPFHEEPGFYVPAMLWLYGNVKLLDSRLAHVEACGSHADHRPAELEAIEQATERLVLEGHVLVTGVHNPAHQRSAVVPLRWGSPRILVFSGGFYHHLGPDLRNEPFRTGRLWRYEFDAQTDLVVSRRAPDKLPTYSLVNETVDRLIELIVRHQVGGELFMGAVTRS